MSQDDGVATLHQTLGETEKGLFFIVGCGRSGTTLLQVMLDCHSQIVLPNETHFYSVFVKRNQWKYGELETAEKLDRALTDLLEVDHIRALKVDPDRVRALCSEATPSWETLFLALLTDFRVQRQGVLVGEKTPRHMSHLFRLYERFPHARFIHVVRDPRAVVLSFLKAPFYKKFGRNPTHAIQGWKDAVTVHRRAVRDLDPKRYTTVRYEDLVIEPRSELERLSEFLGVPFEESMLHYHEREYSGFLAAETHKLGTLKPVYQDSLDKWRKQLPPMQQKLIESALRPLMVEMGFQRETEPSLFVQSSIPLLHLEYKVRAWTRRFLQTVGLSKNDLGDLAQIEGKGDTAQG